MVSPIIDELSDEVSHAKVGKINVDEQGDLAAQFDVMSIPTIIVMKNGKVSSKMVGVQSKDKLLQVINN